MERKNIENGTSERDILEIGQVQKGNSEHITSLENKIPEKEIMKGDKSTQSDLDGQHD